MPDPKKPTAAQKLITMEQMLQSRLASGMPPSERVQVALKSFQTAPTKEEIENVAASMLQSGAPQDALEFKVYAQTMAAPTNARRDAAQRQFDAGSAPMPVVEQALKSFKAPPSPEQIQTIGNYLRATHGEDAGQQFETFAASLVQQKAGAPPPMTDPVRADPPVPPPPMTDPVVADPPTPERRMDRLVVPTSPEPPSLPPGSVNVDIGPAQIERRQPVMQAGPGESDLIQRAKDILQGTGHIVTLGAIPAPQSIVTGNQRLRELTGLDKKPRQGKTTVEPPRDKNRERDLLNEAKNVN